MKRKFYLLALPFCVGAALTLSSCEKLADDATETADSGEDVTETQAAVSTMTNLIMDVAATDPNMSGKKGGNPILPAGIGIRYDEDDSVFTDGDGIIAIIEFGTWDENLDDEAPLDGILSGDGWSRRGYIEIEITAPYTDPDCEIYVYTSSMMAEKDGIRYKLTRKKSKKSRAISIERTGNNSFNVEFEFDVRYHSHKRGSHEHRNLYLNGTFQVQIQDGGTEGVLDDVFTITGSMEGENRNGTPYTVTIGTPLKFQGDATCSKTFIEGKATLKNEDAKTDMDIDFGDGACDNEVVITLPGGIKKTYTL